MASGLASTTRYTGILISVAGLGAIANFITRIALAGAPSTAGLTASAATIVADRVAAGDIRGAAAIAPDVGQAAISAFGAGFTVASLTAAAVAGIAAVLTHRFVLAEESESEVGYSQVPCRVIDCRHPV